ncbi:MAG: hypothetical protein A2X82_00190 [Geobacteraceae bacterium GWC2_55_20]|nr:MAG: hypothetical protein A2X82_00190 [Geobacteraceae bacterium GWC2_55_20]HBA71250.1 hypothetical protein [Geobacter sp.]HCE66900.1 hypothetical protein [Geobacter sp.]
MSKITGCLLFGFMVVIFLSACAGTGYQPLNTANYPVFHKNFDVTIGWNVSGKDGATAVAGYVRNNRYHVMQDLELRIKLFDAFGAEKEQKSFMIIPSDLRLDEYANFSVLFGSSPQTGDKLKFIYRYRGVEDNDGAVSWMDSFEAPLK